MGKTIGIDLGTTNSVAAIVENGKVRILSTGYGERLTPSVVSYETERRNSQGEKIGDGRILVGRSALNNFVRSPTDTIMSVKRLIGRPFNDKIVRQMVSGSRFTFAIEDNQDNDPEDFDIYVLLNGQRYTPVDISAMILRKVKEDAEQALGEEVTHAVITAPNYFGDRQRRATFEAGVKAGLQVKRILTEPNAAAISFGVDHEDENNYILVVDMGGGTTDISVVQSAQSQFKVIGMAGDMWLGGDDFDQVLIEMIVGYVEREFDYSPRQNPGFMSLAKSNAEEAKKALSRQEIADINMPNAVFEPPVSVNFSISRDEFETGINRHLRSVERLVLEAVSDANLTTDDITAVLLVGGSTLVPAVKRILREQFGQERLRVHQDPSEAVAYGAAIAASKIDVIVCPNCETENTVDRDTCKECDYSLTGIESTKPIATDRIDIIQEPLPRTISIGVAKGDRLDSVSPIVEKGRFYPLKEPVRKTFYTTQGTSLVLSIYEGESRRAKDNELQAIVEVHFPSIVKAGAEVVVSLNIDESKLLTVKVEVESQRVETDFIEIRGNVSSAGKHIAEYANLAQNIEKLVTICQSFLYNYGDFLDSDQRGRSGRVKIEDDIRRANEALQNRDEKVMRRMLPILDRSIQDSGIASSLFIADVIILQVAYNPEIERIRRTIEEIKTALRKGDRERVQLLKTTIDAFNSRYNDVLSSHITPHGGLPKERRDE